MRISCNFDSGAIEVVNAGNPANIRLLLRADNAADIRQWFHFRLTGGVGQALSLRFENAGEAAYPEGWADYRCVASYDRRHWFRIPTTRYEGGQLIVDHTPERDSVYYAYFEPYSHERHLDLLGRVAQSPHVRLRQLGATVEGRDLDLVEVGRPRPGRPSVWIIARQHPGETMASWFMEGLLARLLDDSDPVARRVREQACLYLVPHMNPDGAVHGNLRTNAAGANLNREWQAPDPARSPEVWLTRQAMEATGVDLFLDIHGDEALPYVFFSTAEEVPGYPAEARRRQARLTQALLAASPDFQTEQGYQPGRFGDELLALASKWVAHRFGCVSLTLEMPFKDNANLPDGRQGWSAARSRHLGAAMVNAILAHLED
ncbi:MAG: M14-type cytosolic carboxypeptidase [Rhodocyclaceae bacterium]|nr:M14-type cytosolic carboxypeptidase [Rhodocyclaceae bacterium]